MKKILKITKNPSNNFFLIAGPCLIEDELSIFKIGETLKKICDNLDIPLILKGSFLKANRTKISSFSGIGDIKALKILNKVGKYLNIPTLTDVHETSDMKFVTEYVDIIQIPAFLCRQTKLIQSAAETNKIINIKKGQFMSSESIKFAIEKVLKSGNKNVMVTERGTLFGYNDLIVDFRGINVMKKLAPTVIDITHSIQKPNQLDGITSGNPESIETIAKAGIVAGVDGIFCETHHDLKKAKSDSSSMLNLSKIEKMLVSLTKIRQCINKLN